MEVQVNLERLSVDTSEDWDVEKLRLFLKKALLQEILKTDSDQNFYKICLEETLSAINDWRVGDSGFPCSILGCRFKSDRHRLYVRHLKVNHPNLKHVLCNFKRECKRNFSSLDGLIMHIKESHGRGHQERIVDTNNRAAALINFPCKCDLCSGRNFTNVADLMTHYNTFHCKQYRECIFHGCRVSFKASSSSRHHFRLKHKKTGRLKLKKRHLLNRDQSSSVIEGTNINNEYNDNVEEQDNDIIDEYDEADIEFLENTTDAEEEISTELDENYFLEYYSDFLNRMTNFKFVPQTTVQEIAEEYISNTKKSLANRNALLQKALDGTQNISVEEKDAIMKKLENDSFLDAQIKLGSEYKRSKFIKDSQNFVAPEEILLNKEEVRLGARKDVFHYIPIVSSLKTLLQDFSFNTMMARRNQAASDDKIVDLKDGSVYKNCEFFKEHADAYSIVLYSDAVELKNPLGAARGVYKIVQVFFTLADIPKSQRSQVDRFQLVMVFREKLLKKYSLKTIYRRLVADLRTLETGITISQPETRRVRAGVLCYAADNLEASLVGGFSACFSSKDVCRTCHIQHRDLDSHISDYDGPSPHPYWSESEYDAIIQSLDIREEGQHEVSETSEDQLTDESDVDDNSEVEESQSSENEMEGESDGDIIDKRGVKSECPLNILQSFHR